MKKELIYRRIEIKNAFFCIEASWFKMLFLPWALSSFKSLQWFHKLEAKFESKETAIPAIKTGKSCVFNSLRDNRKIDKAKKGIGEIMLAGVLQSFNSSIYFSSTL
jgi:hypothetical protein